MTNQEQFDDNLNKFLEGKEKKEQDIKWTWDVFSKGIL